MRQSASVMHNTLIWIYIILLLVGGLVGFFKAKSPVSLVMAAVFAALLALCAIPGILDARFRGRLANVLLTALIIVFALRLAKTKKFMPAGFMLCATIAVLALQNIFF